MPVDHCPLFSAIFVGHLAPKRKWSKGPSNNYVDKGEVSKLFWFCPHSAQGIKTVHTGVVKNGKILST